MSSSPTQHLLQLAVFALVLLLMTTACNNRKKNGQGTEGAQGSCAPLQIRVNGAPMRLKHGLGRVDESSDVYMVSLFNTPAVQCRNFVQPARLITANEIEFRASVAENTESTTNTVGVGSYTQIVEHARLSQTPEKPGETLAICLPKAVTFTPTSGPLKGQKVEVLGRFEGVFCGPVK